jgi:hypothetical protein
VKFEDRLKVFRVWNSTMSETVGKLGEDAYEVEDTPISGKVKTRIKKIMKRDQG